MILPLTLLFAAVLTDPSPGPIGDQAPAAEPELVLRGEGPMESAPHGEGNIYAPCVLVEEGRWRMWYGAQGRDGHDRIAYAESMDGKTWIKRGIVLRDDAANHVNDPSVVRFRNRYWMYFTRTARDVIDRIDVAVSGDGVQWKALGSALEPTSDGWECLSVGRPSVLSRGDSLQMWYDGRKDFPLGAPVRDAPTSAQSQRCVGCAASSDGRNWKRVQSEPVFRNDAGAVDVARMGNSWLMLYESGDGVRSARSADGLNWRNGGLWMARSGRPIDACGCLTPFLLLNADGRPQRLYYGAASKPTWDQNQIVSTPMDAFPSPLP